jgi:hypothetical protein
VPIWDYYAQKPQEGEVFTNAMHGFTAGVAQDVTRLVDASAARLAVDIGGASGTLVHSLMSANPQLRGIILDLPDVVPSAITAAAALGLTERSSVLAGDFFASVPEADLYLLKHILHDWDDGQALCILENCRRAIRPGGRVVLVELLLGEVGESGFAPISDLNMMVLVTGRERTLSEIPRTTKAVGLPARQEQPHPLVNGSDRGGGGVMQSISAFFDSSPPAWRARPATEKTNATTGTKNGSSSQSWRLFPEHRQSDGLEHQLDELPNEDRLHAQTRVQPPPKENQGK